MPDVPGVLNFPTALDSVTTLVDAKNNASSTITAGVADTDLLIPVADPSEFSTSGFATLTDSLSAPTSTEIFIYTSKSGSNLVVPASGRGAQGTVAAAFSSGAFVEQRPTARHHTVLADAILAIETKLGTGSAIDATKIADGSVSSAEFQYLGGVTSDIQTQLNAKLSSTLPGSAKQALYNNAGALAAAAGIEYQASGSPMVDMEGQTSPPCILRVRESGASDTVATIEGVSGLLNIQTKDDGTMWGLMYSNDASSEKWANFLTNSGLLIFEPESGGAIYMYPHGRFAVVPTGGSTNNPVISINSGGGSFYGQLQQVAPDVFGLGWGSDIDVRTGTALTWSPTSVKLPLLTSNGFVKTSGSDGTLSVDTATYLTGNQSITLSGNVSGTGTTAITTTIGAGVVSNSMLAGSIAASKLVGSDIATVGTITSGTLGAGAALAGVTMTLGSDANGDIYYRASGVLTRLPKGSALDVLRMNAGATAPEWAASSGANTALSNLASVSINASLIPQTGLDLGATATPWKDLYLYGSGTFASHSIKLTGTPTGNRTLTLPNATDTLVALATSDALTNKTLTSSTNVLGGVTLTLGSDADGDIYYRASSVLTRLAKGTALQQLRMNSGATAPEWAAKADSTTQGVFGSRPSASNDGDLYFSTTAAQLSRDLGSGNGYSEWGPMFNFTPVVLTDYTAVNQGGAAATQVNGSVVVTAPTSATDSHRIWQKAVPGGAYTVIMAFMAPILVADNFNYAFVWRQSSDSKLVTLGVSIGGGSAKFEVVKWTNETTFSAAYVSVTVTVGHSVIFLKAEDNTTNRISSVSIDGQNWIQIHSVSRTDFLTANQIGFDLNCKSSTYTAGMTLLSWKQS